MCSGAVDPVHVLKPLFDPPTVYSSEAVILMVVSTRKTATSDE
jgi:hypothetical protein